VTSMVVVWAGRLGTYLVKRIMRDKEDKRFEDAKKNPSTFFVYWTLQVMNRERGEGREDPAGAPPPLSSERTRKR
jgi:hypothetical protein